MKKFLIIVLVSSFVLTGCLSKAKPNQNVSGKVNDNVSAVSQSSSDYSEYCEINGGVVELTAADSSGYQKHICTFADNSECELKSFFEGKCKAGQFLPQQ